MGKSTPPQPDPPNLAGANREGVYASIETMPVQRQIERAARLGERLDFTIPRHQNAAGDWVEEQDRVADFTDLGDVDLTGQEMDAILKMVPTMSQAQLDNLTEFGPQFVKQQREQLRQMAPEEFDLREEFATRLRAGEGTSEELFGEGVDVPSYGEVDAPTIGDTGLTAATRAEMDEQILNNLMQEDRLTGLQQRQAEQGVLKAAASRGQALSGGTALREILAKMGGGMELGRQRRAEAAGWLGSGQAGSDVANTLSQQSFANAMSRVQQMNQARGASFAGQQQNLSQQLGARQQDVGNIQSLLGLQPVAAQGGYMAGLQQGASPFSMPQTQRGIGLDTGAGQAGAQFAGNVFGQQANMWQTQAQLPSAFERYAKAIGDIRG